MLQWVLTWLGGGVLDRVLGHLERQRSAANERDRITAEIVGEHVRAELAARQAARDVIVAQQGRWYLAVIPALFAWPLALWWAAVMLDTTFRFGWRIPDLPNPLIKEWAGWIIGSFFLARSFDGAVRVLALRSRQ